MGILCEIAEVFYKLENMTVHILESRNDNLEITAVEEQTDAMNDAKAVVVRYRLDFDNRDYVSLKKSVQMTHTIHRRKEFNATSFSTIAGHFILTDTNETLQI